MEELFPSLLELTVASSLLLLNGSEKSSSCLSSLTRDDDHRLRMVAGKSGTRIMKRPDHQKKICGEKKADVSMTEAGSCLSNENSIAYCKTKPQKSAKIGTLADGIMRVLSYGGASELRIRELLGNNPYTSKALRMLLKKEQVRRSGIGGRSHPYIYKIA